MNFYLAVVSSSIMILVHYDSGKNVFEEKPINYINFGEIRKYEITFTQYSDDYDFFNAEKLMLMNIC